MENYTKYLNITKKASQKYHDTPNLLGIIWIGSSSYGVCDKLADIDLQLVVSKPDKNFAMQQFKKGNIKIEVDKMNISWLLKGKTPDSEQFWIREKAKILYDPKNILKSKFKKANQVEDKIYKKILWGIYKDIFHSYDFEKSIKRKEKITAYIYVFKAIEALSKFAFIYHQKPVPTLKWRWYFIKKEKLLDNQLIKNLKNIELNKNKKLFNLMKHIETKAQKMMLKKGYPRKKVKEPWLF